MMLHLGIVKYRIESNKVYKKNIFISADWKCLSGNGKE